MGQPAHRLLDRDSLTIHSTPSDATSPAGHPQPHQAWINSRSESSTLHPWNKAPTPNVTLFYIMISVNNVSVKCKPVFFHFTHYFSPYFNLLRNVFCLLHSLYHFSSIWCHYSFLTTQNSKNRSHTLFQISFHHGKKCVWCVGCTHQQNNAYKNVLWQFPHVRGDKLHTQCSKMTET